MEKNSRAKIKTGALGSFLYLIGDYFIGINTFYMGGDSDNALGIVFNVVPDWRYGVSALLGFIGAWLCAVGALELIKVMEQKCSSGHSKLCGLFKIGNLAFAIYGSFVHLALSMLPIVYNAGMDLTGESTAAIELAVRPALGIGIPLLLSFIIMDLFVSVAWIGMIWKGLIPVKKWFMIFNPICIACAGQVIGLIPLPVTGLDSGFESLGWIMMYLVCAGYLAR